MKNILRKIENNLNGMTKEQKTEILEYYEEMINDRLEHGETLINIEKSIDYNEIRKNYLPKAIYQSKNKNVKESFKVSAKLFLYLISSPFWIPLAIIYFVIIFVMWVFIFSMGLITLLVPISIFVWMFRIIFDTYSASSTLLTIGYGFILIGLIIPLGYFMIKLFKHINDTLIRVFSKLVGGNKKEVIIK
ncbi:Conserved hypothetical protein (DUF1700) [Alteracholeplasma palmae J233]|uniref:DUF1700 domain-containing protein n=1 Tax=Alteracholeplasma palmae (strain ATCC 49389 / J233) TaxID=1318466 RepID=U4KJL9_ALTPJ|nr:DUF1700 domain-containing protein [Alteracholeplasma palmae]CCV63719.1 Conserved hypothetical protein (DUF1700) [Alteracholeplasma palmae J233]